MSGSSQQDARMSLSPILYTFCQHSYLRSTICQINKSDLNRGQKITRTQNEFGVINRSNNNLLEWVSVRFLYHPSDQYILLDFISNSDP